jgi:hypothetical protein
MTSTDFQAIFNTVLAKCGAGTLEDDDIDKLAAALSSVAGGISNAELAEMVANTIKMNATDAAAVPTDTVFAANTFPARASTGNLAAKTITDASLSALATGLGTVATQDADAVAITGGTISSGVNLAASSVNEDVASAAASANIDIAIAESTSISHVIQVRAEDASGHRTTHRAVVDTSRSGSAAPTTSGAQTVFEYISSGTGVTIACSISSNSLRTAVTNAMGADCHMTIRIWAVESDATVEDS